MTATIIQQQLDGQRRLEEYNKWLLDPKREIGVPYPKMREFIGNVSSEKEKTMNSTTMFDLGAAIAKATVKTPVKQPKAVKAPRAPRAGTKQEKVNEIVKQAFASVGKVDKSFKADMVAKIMVDVGMTKAGATTYLYNAIKAL